MIYCWGSSRGLGPFTNILKPQPLNHDEIKVKSFCSGRSHSLIIDDKNNLYMIGDGKLGQNGIGTFDNFPTPNIIKDIKVSNVQCWDISLAIGLQGELYSWGPYVLSGLSDTEIASYIGTNEQNNQYCNIPRRIDSLSDVFISSVSCSLHHCLAVDRNGDVYSWGYSGYGRLGLVELGESFINNDNRVTIPTRIKSFTNRSITIEKAECGQYHSLFLSNDNTVYSCGTGSATGLEDDSHDNDRLIIEPTLINSLSDIINISTGYCHSLALDKNGNCFIFGMNYNGQFGNGIIDQGQSEPTIINELSNVKIISIDAGACHNAFISDEGDLYVFGGALVENLSFRMNVAIGDGNGGLDTLQFPVKNDEDETVISENITLKPKSHLTNINSEQIQDIENNNNSNNVMMTKEELEELNYLLSEQIYQTEANNQLTPQKLSIFSDKSINMVSCGLFHTLALTLPYRSVVTPLKKICIERLSKVVLEYPIDELKLSIPSELFPEINSYLHLSRLHNDRTLRLFSNLKEDEIDNTTNSSDGDLSNNNNNSWSSFINIMSKNYEFENSFIYSLDYKCILATDFDNETKIDIENSIIKNIDYENNETLKFKEDKKDLVINNIKYIIISAEKSSIVSTNESKDTILLIFKTQTLLVVCKTSIKLSDAIQNLNSILKYMVSNGY